MAKKHLHKRAALPWSRIGGHAAARDRLIENLVVPLRHPDAAERLGIRPAKALLLYGPPGLGKSRLACAAAEAAGAHFASVGAPELLSKAVEEAEKALDALFAPASSPNPTLIFLDELELLAPARVANMGESQRSERLFHRLLTHMDQLPLRSDLVLLGATARPGSLDPLLLRPGRLDELIYVGVPDVAGRQEILTIMSAAMPLAKDVDLQDLAERTARFTAADVEDMLRRAGLHALSKSMTAKKITKADFDAALAMTKASVTETMERDYEKLQGEIKQNALKLEPMGFLGAGQLKPVRDSKHSDPE
jgi:transitional endoplasmic reticulum ATPase